MKVLTAKGVAELAKNQVADLTDLAPDTVSAVSRNDAGWRVDVEMIELKRIPDGQDVLATYRCEMDPEGNLLSYVRARRYYREETSGLYE